MEEFVGENGNDFMDISSSDSSDDSVDLESSECHPVKGQYGIGSVLMQKMGYTAGCGLGVSGQGILEPVELKRRAKNTGLGSIPAVDEPSTEAVDEAGIRKDKINAQLSELRELLRLLETQSPQNIDILELYERFGKSITSIWEMDKLWEILEVCASCQLGGILIKDYSSGGVLSVLAILEKQLPSSRYRSLLQTTWLRKLQAASASASAAAAADSTENEVLPLAIHELATNRFLDPVRKHSIECIASNYLHSILENSVTLQQFSQLLPELPEILLGFSDDMDSAEELTLCSVLTPSQVYSWFSGKIKLASGEGGGSNTIEIDHVLNLLAQWKEVLSASNNYDKILIELIYPNCFTYLLSQMRSGKLTTSLWSKWQLKLPQSPDRDVWLLKGLNAINEMFDTGRLVVAEEKSGSLEANLGPEVSLADVLRFYGERLGYKVNQLQANKGELTGANGSCYLWKIEDEVFYIKMGGGSYKPVSIYDIANYIS